MIDHTIYLLVTSTNGQCLERASETMTSVIYNGAYQIVLQPPVRGAVMGIDPGYKSGTSLSTLCGLQSWYQPFPF
jgi:transcriptional accessory protein Tex/SPT6